MSEHMKLVRRVLERAEETRNCAHSIFALGTNGKPANGAIDLLLTKIDSVVSAAHIAATSPPSEMVLDEQAQLSALTYEDIYRAMRSYGFDGIDHVQQEGMRRALVSFILKRDVRWLPRYTVADGHRVSP